MGSQPLLGSIHIFPYNFAPRGYAYCQGQSLSITQNTALFSLLGTTYGGNGQTTFNLPDLRGRVPLGVGQGPGLSNYVLGQQGGAQAVTLTSTNLPTHNHALSTNAVLNAVQAKASSQSPDVGSLLARAIDASGNTPAALPEIYVPAGTSGTQVGLGGLGGFTEAAGSNAPVPVLPPYLTLAFCIALQGIFPTRN